MPEIPLPDYPFSAQIGWSNTRSETFRSCRRRYFYQYYARYVTEVAPDHLLRLRNLSTLAMTKGLAVHDVLATLLRRLLRSSAPIDRERLARHAEQTVVALLARSEMMEVYYRQRSEPQISELLQPLLRCLDAFLASERFSWLLDVLAADPPYLIEPPGYGESRLRELKIYAKVDCLFVVDGSTLILDWKTGRQDPTRHLRQLLGYAAWAEHNLAAVPEQIVCVAAYFEPTYAEIEKRPDFREIEALAAEVSAELKQMESLCRDPARNVPLEPEAFPLTDNLQICRHCAFRELCDRVESASRLEA